MDAYTTVGDDGYVLYKASEWEVCWKTPHSYGMHNPQRERCVVLPWKGVRGAFFRWKEQFCEPWLCCSWGLFFPALSKLKSEGRRWKSGPETCIYLVYFIEVRDCDKVTEPPSSLTLWNWNLQRYKRKGHFYRSHCQITAANHSYFLL